MNETAVVFEYERMGDGSTRLRFLTRDGWILGQQVVSAKAMLTLQILLSVALSAATAAGRIEPEACSRTYKHAMFQRRPRIRGLSSQSSTSPSDPDS